MLFSWFELILLIGVFQGVITSILLFKDSSYPASNKLLGTTLLCFSAGCIKMVINSTGIGNTYEWFNYVPLAFETALPPLAFFYCLSLTQSTFKLSGPRLLHFVPVTFFMGYAIFVYVNLQTIDSAKEQQAFLTTYHYSLIKEIEDYLTVVSIAVYITLGSFVLKRFRSQANNFTSDNSHAIFKWLRSIQVLMIILLAFLVTNMALERLGVINPNSILHWKIYFVYLAVVVYYLGLKAYKSPIHLNQDSLETPDRTGSVVKLPESQAKSLASDIEKVIEEQKLYLNPTFSIQELSQILQVNQSTVSQVINRYLGSSFRELINQKRIALAKELLIANADKGISILSQALECGFNSEASFYRVFKKHTGKSPKQYIKWADDTQVTE